MGVPPYTGDKRNESGFGKSPALMATFYDAPIGSNYLQRATWSAPVSIRWSSIGCASKARATDPHQGHPLQPDGSRVLHSIGEIVQSANFGS